MESRPTNVPGSIRFTCYGRSFILIPYHNDRYRCYQWPLRDDISGQVNLYFEQEIKHNFSSGHWKKIVDQKVERMCS